VVKYGFGFQPAPRVYHEPTFAHFDRVVKEAAARQIKLIVTLVNNWSDFGGMDQYNAWCGVPSHDGFYTNEATRALYKDYVAYFLNRTNTLTGVQYKHDPTIMAWELANEPRCRSDTTGVTLNQWIGEMSAFIKSIDTNHLVTTGVDGGYLDKGADPWAWWYKGNEGQDFYGNHQWPGIDFATFHYYTDMDPTLNVAQWIKEHIEDAHGVIGKPVVLGEFNSKTNRLQTLTEWYGDLETNGVDGDLLWMLATHDVAGNNDGYFVFYPEDTNVCQLISAHALFMRSR